MSLTKADIIENIAARKIFSIQEAQGIVEDLLEIIKSALESGEDVLVSGFGKFCVNEKAPRKGRNPAAGKGEHLKYSAKLGMVSRCLSRVINNFLNRFCLKISKFA